jgi:hypothetical protein
MSWIPDVVAVLFFVLIFSALSFGSTSMLLVGMREVRAGSFNGRVVGLQCILVAIVPVRVVQRVFVHAVQAHPGLTALGVATGVLAGIMVFRTSKPTRYPSSRLRLWLWTAITLALVAWVFAT